MHRAFGASGFIGQEGATGNARLGVSRKLGALWAEPALRVMLRVTIQRDHLSDSALLLGSTPLGSWGGSVGHGGILYLSFFFYFLYMIKLQVRTVDGSRMGDVPAVKGSWRNERRIKKY
jgi:hypothetical protein